MNIKSVAEADIKNKKVIVRVDFNTPLDKNGNVTSDKRIRAALPTLKYLIESQARVIILTHAGRPNGEVVEKLRVNGIASRLSELLEVEVKKIDTAIGEKAEKAVSGLQPGEVLMLENIRFYPEEKKNDAVFAQKIASMGDLFVNDGFGVSHRDHASITGIPKFLPSYAGFLVEKEVDTLTAVRDNPEKPLVVVMGGAKLETRIPMIDQFLEKAEKILLSGGMIFTFYKALGKNIGKSLLDVEHLDTAKMLLEKYPEKLVLPIDIVVAKEFKENADSSVVSVDNIAEDDIGLDVGPKTVELFSNLSKEAETIIWNGPFGVFEMSPFQKGTFDYAQAISEMNAHTIIGGGDTAAAIEIAGLQDKMSFMSTGGGASLMLLEGKKLPGIEVLKK